MKFLKSFSSILLISLLFFSCQKEYSLETPVAAPGTWQFNDSTKLFTGNIDTAFIETTGTTKILHLLGPSADGLQTFSLNLYATDSFTVGAYKASLNQNDFEYYTLAKTIYLANQVSGEFIVNITAIGNSKIAGTFSGSVQDSAGTTKTLSKGLFSSKINLSNNGTGGGGTTSATGTLGVSAGVCTPASNSGTYTQGIALTASNTVQLTVNVATTGTYSIATNTVNGVTFSAAGTFTTTGVQNVILTGSGTPTNSGSQTFAVTFGASTCSFAITFGAGVAQAMGTLGGGPGTCTPVTPAGTYTQGVALTSSNTLQIQVNVTTLGAYTITTNTVNGVNFSKSGTFTTTGIQNVILTGSGTPTNSGSQNFAVTFGTSTCNFAITFIAGTPPATDYFPTTIGLNWTYGLQGGTPTDSLFDNVINYNKTVSGKVYSTIAEESFPVTGIPDDSLYFRKSGGDYYQLENFLFDAPTNGEFIFLKDNVAQGTIWQSQNFTGSSGGTTYTAFIKMTLTAKSVTATSGSVTSTDVIKVHYDYYVTTVPIPFATEDRWFAKGIGLIYDSLSSGGSTDTYNIGQYH